MRKLRLLLFIGMVAVLLGVFGLIAMLLGALGQTVVHTTSYSIVSGDNYQTVVMNCSSACTVTLPRAGTLSSSFKTRIFSRGTAVATLASASTIYGGKTLLPGMYTDIVIERGSAYDSMRNSNVYEWAMTTPKVGDTLRNAGNFATTYTLFANLPAQTIVHMLWSGLAPYANNNSIFFFSYLDTWASRRGEDGNFWCYGDQYYSSVNENSQSWEVDCRVVIRTTGTSGTRWDTTTATYQILDTDTGYQAVQIWSYPWGSNSPTGAPQPIDTTTTHTIYLRQYCATSSNPCAHPPPANVYLKYMTVEITLPWDG